MSFEETPKFKNNHPESEGIRERVFFPHSEEIAKAFENYFGKEAVGPMETETIKEILNTYIEQKIENTHVYTSEKLGASFVYSVTDIADLAKTLYANFTKEDVSHLKEDTGDDHEKAEKEFMFIGGFYNTEAGNEYVSQEKIFHDIFIELPGAMKDIISGKEPKKKEIYTLASPTNELGEVSEKFVDGIEESSASSQFASLYAEFIKSIAEKNNTGSRQNLSFNGMSIGAGIAIETAKKLLEENVATQSITVAPESTIPLLRLRIDTPPGQSDISPKVRKWQIPLGFAIEVGRMIIADTYLRSVMMDDKKFMASKNAILEEKGIVKHMSKEQEDLKKETISLILKNLNDGVEIPKDLTLTEVIGTTDPLMYTPSFNKKLEEHQNSLLKERKEKEMERPNVKSVGEHIVSREEYPKRRTFGVSMGHNIPFLRDSEFKRLRRAVKSITDLVQ